MLKPFAIGLLGLLAGGCASSSAVQPYSTSSSHFDPPTEVMAHSVPQSQVFRLYQRAATGFETVDSLRASVESRARSFCESRGGTMQVLGEKISEPPYILGNYPQIEIVFACADRVSAAPLRATEDAKYYNLGQLKKLLDDGAITQTEYEVEKERILKMR